MFNTMKNLLIKITAFTALAVTFQAQAAFAGEQGEAVKKTKYFLKWDTDGDQKLNLEEFTAMTRKQFENKGNDGWEEAAKKRFKNKDADQDGYISFEEQFEGMKMAK